MRRNPLIITSVMMLSIGFVPQAFSEETPTPAPTKKSPAESSQTAEKKAAQAAKKKAAQAAEKKAAQVAEKKAAQEAEKKAENP